MRKLRKYIYMGFGLTLFMGELFANTTEESSIMTLALGSFSAGIFLTLTPCVLPMVPILSSIIVGQGEHISKTKAFLLSLSYVFGTAVTYAGMGALAGATGEQLQSYFQNIWAIGALSMIFLFMALSMFGLFTIQLPTFIQSSLNARSHTIKGGNYTMVFFLGVISALIIGACVSPILIAFLGVALSKGDALLGAITMFSMALGMGVPLLLLGIGMGQFLPKAGAWMDNIKYIFGILLLATAIYLFNTLGLLPATIVWSIFAGGVALLLLFKSWIGLESGILDKGIKSLGIILLLISIWFFINATNKYIHRNDISHKVTNISPFSSVSDLKALQVRQLEATNLGKPLILYFYSDSCSYFLKMKEGTFKNPLVIKLLQKEYIALKVDLTDKSNETTQAIKRKYHVFGVPTFIFFDKKRRELSKQSAYGYLDAEAFFDLIELMLE